MRHGFQPRFSHWPPGDKLPYLLKVSASLSLGNEGPGQASTFNVSPSLAHNTRDQMRGARSTAILRQSPPEEALCPQTAAVWVEFHPKAAPWVGEDEGTDGSRSVPRQSEGL